MKRQLLMLLLMLIHQDGSRVPTWPFPVAHDRSINQSRNQAIADTGCSKTLR